MKLTKLGNQGADGQRYRLLIGRQDPDGIVAKRSNGLISCIAAGLLLAYFATPSAISQTREPLPLTSPSQPARPIPEVVTMEQKLSLSNHVFIGTGRRIYFIDRFYNEVPFEMANANSRNSTTRHALLEVDIDRNLYPRNMHGESMIAKFFVISSITGLGSAPSGQDELTARYVGRPSIYFTQMYIENIFDFERERAPIVGTIVLHRLVATPALSGPTENPLPLSEIQEVMKVVNQRISRDASRGTAPRKPHLVPNAPVPSR